MVILFAFFNSSALGLRIRNYVLLHLQIIQDVEIRVQIVVLVQFLQIAHRRTALNRHLRKLL